MNHFMQKHSGVATSVLQGFDRLLFRGTLRGLSFIKGMVRHISYKDVPRREFGNHVEKTTKRLIGASLEDALRLERPVIYLSSSKTRKEEIAKKVLVEQPVKEGLVCVLHPG